MDVNYAHQVRSRKALYDAAIGNLAVSSAGTQTSDDFFYSVSHVTINSSKDKRGLDTRRWIQRSKVQQ